jgi:hypothetical protein
MKRSSLCLMFALLAGCKTEPKQEAAPAASTTASAPAPAAAAPAVAQKAWFVGEFSGQYESKLVPVDIKVGAVREWSKDDGKASSGPGKLSLKIAEDGTVEGTSEGSLGAAHVTGKVEEDTLRIQLDPSDDAGLHGVLVASRDGDGFKGAINASSGDSLRVRQATIELKKSAN